MSGARVNKTAIFKLKFLCCFILLPVLSFGQETKDFQFYNQTNAEILENYYLTVFENETINNFFPNEKHKISIAKETILKSDSIHLNANFQTIKLSKTGFNTETINVELSQSLDEVVFTQKSKEKHRISNSKLFRRGVSTNSPEAVLIDVEKSGIGNSKIKAVEIFVKGTTQFLNSKTPANGKTVELVLSVNEDIDSVKINKIHLKKFEKEIIKDKPDWLRFDLSKENVFLSNEKYLGLFVFPSERISFVTYKYKPDVEPFILMKNHFDTTQNGLLKVGKYWSEENHKSKKHVIGFRIIAEK